MLRLTTRDDIPNLLEFERVNREFFEKFVPPRPSAFFDTPSAFSDRMATLLAEQASGRTLLYILLNDHEDILGRLNLTILSKNSAEMGYRVAKTHTGQNLMSRAIQKLEPIAVRDLNLSKLLARAAASNPASVHTLLNAGFKRKADEERTETLNNSPIILSLYEKELA